MTSPVLLPSRVQIRLDIIRADRFKHDPERSYIGKELAGLVCVVRDNRKGEIFLSHMLTQCDKRVIADVLLGNTESPEGSLLRLRKRRRGFSFMRRKSVEKALRVWRPAFFLTINICSA